jgi:hypothetical protein
MNQQNQLLVNKNRNQYRSSFYIHICFICIFVCCDWLAKVTAVGSTSICSNDNGDAEPVQLSCYVIDSAHIITSDGPSFDGMILVIDGNVKCMGSGCASTVPANCQHFTLAGGVITPGFIETGSHIGQYDIESETVSNDGELESNNDGSYSIIRTIDGVRLNTRHMNSTWMAGITTVITRPQGSALVTGMSSTFDTCCGGIIDDLISCDGTALHINLGNRAKGNGISASVSGQIAAIRNLFVKAK